MVGIVDLLLVLFLGVPYYHQSDGFHGVGSITPKAPVTASQPPGQLGYEGQPGNQGGYNQAGQKGYEGQPGNQSNGN